MPDRQPSPQQEESCRVTEDGAVIADTKWRRPRFNTVGELHFASLSACLIFGSRSDTFCTVNPKYSWSDVKKERLERKEPDLMLI